MKKFIFIFVVLLHLAFNIDNCMCQWVKQYWPTFESTYGVSFFDENTGFVAGKTFPAGYYALYKTTNAGFNWVENYRPIDWIFQTQKIDDTTIYMLGDNNVQYVLYRSFNRGVTWDSLIYPVILGFYFISKDTGWASMSDNDHVRYYKTNNGGVSFSLLYSQFSTDYQTKLFFLKEKYNGNYIGYRSELSDVKKTTDGGYNWIDLPALPIVPQYDKNGKLLTQPDITQITFINKDTGWVTNGTKNIFKTTNGGNNWIIQNLPNLHNSSSSFYHFKIINKDTLYSDDAWIGIGSHSFGIVLKTTNGGDNWGYQIPDTNVFPNASISAPEFINSNTGWFRNIHTTNGGGPIIYTAIKNISVANPGNYQLFQNYPNPFNPSTTVDFYLPRKSDVFLKIYDISGRLIFSVINGFQLQQGYHSYRIDNFSSLGMSSGIYFYKLTASDKSRNILYQETKKMIYTK